MALQTLNSPTIIPQPTDPLFASSFPTGKRSNKRTQRNFKEEEYLAMCLVKLTRGTNEIIKRPISLTLKYPASLEQVKIVQVDEEKSVLITMEVKKVHICNVCNRSFSSHQALGGHKASHRSKPIRTVVSLDVKNVKLSTGEKSHECNVCHKTFPTGQALGGHMRKHYDGVIGGGGVGVSTKNRSSDGGAAKSPSNEVCATVERKVQDFDLNVSLTEDINCDEGESDFM